MSAASLTTAHAQFTAALPAITSTARYAFRRRRHQDRAEAVAEAQACAWKAWRGLVERGKDGVRVALDQETGIRRPVSWTASRVLVSLEAWKPTTS